MAIHCQFHAQFLPPRKELSTFKITSWQATRSVSTGLKKEKISASVGNRSQVIQFVAKLLHCLAHIFKCYYLYCRCCPFYRLINILDVYVL